MFEKLDMENDIKSQSFHLSSLVYVPLIQHVIKKLLYEKIKLEEPFPKSTRSRVDSSRHSEVSYIFQRII